MSSLEDIIEPSWNFIKKSCLGLTLCATVLAYSSCKKETSSQNEPQKRLVEAEESPIEVINKFIGAVKEDNYGKALNLYFTEKEAKEMGESYINEYYKDKEEFADGFNKLSIAMRKKEIELIEFGGEIREPTKKELERLKFNYKPKIFDLYIRVRIEGDTKTTEFLPLITTKEGKWRLICW